MAISVSVSDPIVYWLAFGQPYAATVAATDSGDPPVLSVTVGDRTFTGVPYSEAAQAPNTWCLYTDTGRPGTLPDPDLVITSAVYLTQADADARYPAKAAVYTKTQADAAFPAKAAVYTKTEADAAFPATADVYTKTEADAAFAATGHTHT